MTEWQEGPRFLTRVCKKCKVNLVWDKKCPECAVSQCEHYTFEGLNSMPSIPSGGGLGAGLSAQSWIPIRRRQERSK